MNTRRVIVVANRLPVSVERKEGRWQMRRTVGGLASALSAVAAYTDLHWIGWPGFNTNDKEIQATVTEKLAGELNCQPVFVPSRVFERFYHGLSNNCLWPLFHYFPRTARYEAAEWDAYRTVNQLFADRVAALAQPGDQIWVHDYHLLLLPALLRQRLPETAIGFFLHIPFPTYELFRELPWREALLRGVLGADLVGFHTYDYTRHFLNSLLRGLGLEQDFGQVAIDGRLARVDTFPLGIDTEALEAAAEQATGARVRRAPPPADQRLILSVDRLDFTKGIPQRLLAFDRFLERYPEWHGRVRLRLICVPTRERVLAYKELKRRVDELVGQVNGRFSTPAWTPIQYLYRSFETAELAGFYRQAHVALVTPLRDGMNLIAKEYLASRPDESGVLVLSETAGAAAELGEALIVNANDLDGMADALYSALTMPLAEQVERNRPMRARLRRYDVRRWADDFLSRLDDAHAGQQQQRRRRLEGAWRDELVAAYRTSRRRLLLLDYDGTLVPLVATPSMATPDEVVLGLLQRLAAPDDNRVVVISGRDNLTLERWLRTTGVVLVAEHGAWVLEDETVGWRRLASNHVSEWKDRIRPVLEIFVDRTPGALLEEKELGLAWHYRNADPELGSQRAKELGDTLSSLLGNTSLQVLRGSKVLEVKESSVGKGQTALTWLNATPPPDFVLAIGDDETDELLFEATPEAAWSIRVGYNPRSRARFYVDQPGAVRELLASLAEEDTQ